MSGFWTPIIDGITTFFRGWGYALVETAPSWAKPHLAHAWSPLDIDIAETGSLRHRTDLIGHDLDLILAPEFILEHRFHVPEAAVKEMKRVVALEAERVMPISAGKLITSFTFQKTPEVTGTTVCLVATRRSLIQNLLDDAEDSRLTVRSIRTNASSGPIEFPIPALRRRRQLSVGVMVLAALTALFIVSMAPTLYLDKLNTRVSDTDRAIREAKTKTRKIAGLQRQVKSLQSLANAVQSAQDHSRIIELLATLTKASPDDIVISELNLDDQRLRISGRGNSPENWVLSLQKQPAFKDVRLTSVLGQANDEKRRFEIRLTVIWPAERHET